MVVLWGHGLVGKIGGWEEGKEKFMYLVMLEAARSVRCAGVTKGARYTLGRG